MPPRRQDRGRRKRSKRLTREERTGAYPRPELAGAIKSPKAKRSGVGKPEAAKIGKKGRGPPSFPTGQRAVVLTTRKLALQQGRDCSHRMAQAPCSLATRLRPHKHPLRCARQR